MSVQFTLPEGAKIVEGITPGAGAALTGDYVSLKNYHCAYVILHVNQVAVNTIAISVNQATTVAGAGTIPITQVVPIWANETCATTDALVRQADAVNFTTSAAQLHKIVVFKVDAEKLDATFDCIAVLTGASDATNITGVTYILMPSRYAQSTPPSAIID